MLALGVACGPGSSAVQSPAPTPAAGGFLSPGSGAPKRGGTLIGGAVGNEPAHFDVFQGGGSNASGLAYEGLIWDRGEFYDDIAKVPGLAEKWETSADGMTWTLTIRQGVRFQNIPPVNGRPMTAEDVAWNINQLATASTVQASWKGVMEKVTARDQYTVEIKLQFPFPPFINLIAPVKILAHEVFEQYGHFRELPIGTGAWIFDGWERGNTIKWKANPDYWRMGADGKPLPYASNFQWFAFKDESAAAAAIRANQLLLYPYPDPVSMDPINFRQLKKDRPDLVYQDGQRANINALYFNHRIAPWNDVRARRAIALGMNRDEIMQVGFQGDTSPTGLIPANLTDWAWQPDKIKEKYTYDKATAQQMVKDLGLLGTDVEVFGGNNKASDAAMPVFIAQLEDLGFKPTQRIPPTLAQHTQILLTGNFQLDFSGGGTSAEPDTWLYNWWHTGGASNQWGYSNPALDQLVDAERRELDPAKRKSIVDQCQELLWEEMAGVPICMKPLEHRVVNPKVKNLRTVHQNTDFNQSQSAQLWIEG
jgi:peptide/nickel transport system substrate-binding protein